MTKKALVKLAIARRGPGCAIKRGWMEGTPRVRFGYILAFPVYGREQRIYLGRTLAEAESALLALPKTTW